MTRDIPLFLLICQFDLLLTSIFHTALSNKRLADEPSDLQEVVTLQAESSDDRIVLVHLHTPILPVHRAFT